MEAQIFMQDVKEMKYTSRLDKAEVLANSTYNGYEYVVLSMGTHPCAYVVLNEGDKFYGKDYDTIHDMCDLNDFYLDCHCGLTYSEPYLNFLEFSEKYRALVKTSIKDHWVIGWDYAHYGDYFGGSIFDDDGKRWTTTEIVSECKEFIDQLNTINGE